MKSTGEVMGIAGDFPTAFGKAQAAAGVRLPESGSVFITVTDTDKAAATQLATRFHDLGFEVIATHGTAQAIERMAVSDRGVLDGVVSGPVPEHTDRSSPERVSAILRRMDSVVLVLNQNYEPLNVCNLPRAFRLLFGEKAEVIEYDHQVIRTPRRNTARHPSSGSSTSSGGRGRACGCPAARCSSATTTPASTAAASRTT